MPKFVVTRVALLALATLAMGSLLVSTASAASDNNPKADIHQSNGSCGTSSAGTVIGFTNFHRTGDVVSVEYHLKDAPPDTTFTPALWGDVCSSFGSGPAITTNDHGVANANFDVTVPHGSTRFFATSFSGSTGFNDTTAVTLLP